MGQAASKAQEARAAAKSRPKQTRSVLQQKLKTATATGVLALPDHKLKQLPRELLELANLRSLDVSSNRLTELPRDFATALPQLRTLKLAGNALTALPDLSALTALTTVRMCVRGRALTGTLVTPSSYTTYASPAGSSCWMAMRL